MTITVSVTKDVTDLSVTDTETSLTITPNTIELGVVDVAFSQASSADAISSEATGHITATNVQAALAEIGADPQFTSTLKNKLDNVEEEANKLTAGTNVNISEGAINADVLGAISAGQNISISETGEISASAVSLTDVYTAANETEHLNLDPTPNQGDVVIRTDENKTYIHNGGTAGTMADYTELATTGGVNSINGATGVVTFGKANLNDYSANEFIDWTVGQAQDIHADNYTNTTYSAGTNITIDENNQISSTGGGTTNTAGDGISIDNGAISLDTDYLYDTIKFSFTGTSTDSGVYVRTAPDIYNPSGIDFHGLYVYLDDPREDTDVKMLAAFTVDEFFVNGRVNVSEALRLDNETIVTTIDEADSDYSSTTKIKLNDLVYVSDRNLNDNSKNIANTKYVDAAVADLEQHVEPLPTFTDTRYGGYLYYNQNDALEWRKPNINVYATTPLTDNEVDFYVADSHMQFQSFGDLGVPLTIQGGTGVTVTQTGGNGCTISANPDGLPDQTEAVDNYVLTSEYNASAGEGTAVWTELTTAVLPDQTASNNKYLKSVNGTATWEGVDAFPDQTDNSGKFLTTNGTLTSWAEVDALPTQSASTDGQFLASDGVNSYWAETQTNIPAQSSHTGKFLTTDGNSLSWSTINTAGQTGNITFSSSTISSSDTDTVTIGDKLLCNDTISAEDISLNSAGTPSVISTSSYNITAPDGVYFNGCAAPVRQFFVEIPKYGSDNDQLYSQNGITVRWRTDGSSEHYVSIACFNAGYNNSNAFVECSLVQTYSQNDPEPSFHTRADDEFASTFKTFFSDRFFEGRLMVKIYEL
jgi:hypothetical protein